MGRCSHHFGRTDATPAFIALESDLNALRPVLETADFEVAEDATKALDHSVNQKVRMMLKRRLAKRKKR